MSVDVRSDVNIGREIDKMEELSQTLSSISSDIDCAVRELRISDRTDRRERYFVRCQLAGLVEAIHSVSEILDTSIRSAEEMRNGDGSGWDGSIAMIISGSIMAKDLDNVVE